MISSRMIHLESLNTKPASDAREAYCKLRKLQEESSEYPLGLNGKVVITARELKRRGYETHPPRTVYTALVLDLIRSEKGEVKESSCRAHFTLADQGGVDASLPEGSISIEGGLVNRSAVSYGTLFTPEISLPLVNWLMKMIHKQRYIDPPKFSLPKLD